MDIDTFWGGEFDGGPDSGIGQRFSYLGEKSTRIEGILFESSEAKATIICLPGKSESFIKYREVAWDLYRQLNVNIVMIDHRGQGLSQRLTEDNQRVHVDSYFDYVEDLRILIEEIVLRLFPNQSLTVFAHSMGAAIASLLMMYRKDLINSAVFTAPMYTLRSDGYPPHLVELFVWLNCIIGRGKEYAFGYKRLDTAQWVRMMKLSTTSQARLMHYQSVIEAHTEKMITYGMSYQWVHEWHKATRFIRHHADLLVQPMLIFSAELEELIVNDGQYTVNDKALNSDLVVVRGAKHEIHFERDEIRVPYFEKVIQFFRHFL